MAIAGQPHVVIIGAGVGGASSAYYLKKEVPEVKVTILEARDRIGGRIHDTDFFGKKVNLGAAKFSAEQKNIAELTKELKLPKIRFPSTGGFPNDYVWDGQDFTKMSDVLRREPAADANLQRSLKEYLSALDANYQQNQQESFRSVPMFLQAGRMNAYSNQSISELFTDTPVDELVRRYTIEPVERIFFGQGLEKSGRLGMVCIASVCKDTFTLEGGMGELVRALVSSSGCELRLKACASIVKKTDAERFEVWYSPPKSDTKRCVTADFVIIAAPLEWADVKFEGFKSDPVKAQPIREWQRLYYYVSYVAAESIRPAYFKKESSVLPNPVSLYTTSNTTQPWIGIRYSGLSRGYNIYCVYAAVDITSDGLVHEMFNGVQDYISHQWKYTYPVVPPISGESGYQSLVLDDHVFSLNGIESVASQMEFSVTSGRNAAKLVANALPME